ncbi:MAG: signal recognition particle-docking protein FtsY [Acidimicrobiia bacterium]|nr:signal recognition particle-docking protein FtsY [Acidimicrobiia bacterium]
MEWIYLVLIALVVAFGVAVLIVNRRRAARTIGASSAPRVAPPTAPPRTAGPAGTAVLEPDVVEPPAVEPEVVATATLRERMARARAALAGAFVGIRGRSGINAETWDDLEEALLRADVGIGVTTELLDGLRTRVKDKELTEPAELLDALQAEMQSRLSGADRQLHFVPDDDAGDGHHPNVWLFVGVNGVGKTTTIGKVAQQQRSAGRNVLLAAGDTFRAAAAEQLTTWAERAGAELVRGSEGGDPSAVVFDAVERASSRQFDLVLADTAGRLHTKTNLMEELRKVRRVAEKGAGRVTEVLLVIDATTGQNGLTQAREFGDATQVTGIVLTKLDGSAKGGIVFAVETELGIPIKLVGIGETIADLVPFDPDEFVAALFED